VALWCCRSHLGNGRLAALVCQTASTGLARAVLRSE
jgi:hypothetical protein